MDINEFMNSKVLFKKVRNMAREQQPIPVMVHMSEWREGGWRSVSLVGCDSGLEGVGRGGVLCGEGGGGKGRMSGWHLRKVSAQGVCHPLCLCSPAVPAGPPPITLGYITSWRATSRTLSVSTPS